MPPRCPGQEDCNQLCKPQATSLYLPVRIVDLSISAKEERQQWMMALLSAIGCELEIFEAYVATICTVIRWCRQCRQHRW